MTSILRFLLLALIGSAALPARAQSFVFIANQGNFNDQNGSVTFMEPRGMPRDLVQARTVLQSLHLAPVRLYLMANTSNWVDVYNPFTGVQTGRIEGVFSPRYMTSNDSLGYVTNLYKEGANFTGGTVTVIDLRAETVRQVIDVGDNPEGLALAGNRLYVANHGFGSSTTVSVIDTDTETVVDTIDVGCDGPRFVFVDAQDELVVFCTGKTVWNETFTEILEQTNGQIVFWSPPADSATARIELPRQLGTTGPGQDAYFEPELQEAYTVMENRILRIDTEQNALTDTLIAPGEDPIGAVAYDVSRNAILLGRVPDFTSRGYVSRLARDGSEVGTWEAGIAPSYIAFIRVVVPAVEPGTGVPRGRFSLEAGYPNPFHREAKVRFTLLEPASIALTVHTLDGREVATLARETLAPGAYERSWTASGLAAGVYLVRLQADDFVETRPLTLIR